MEIYQFNERHIPNSPYIVRVSPPAADAHKVEIAQFPQGVIQTNTPSQFLVRKNGAKGDIDAKVNLVFHIKKKKNLFTSYVTN